MKSWMCELCKKQISELGAYVKGRASVYQHLTCHDERVAENAMRKYAEDLRIAKEEDDRIARELKAAEERAAQEQARAKLLAQENAKNEAARIAALTQQAREALKREQQGTGGERFTLVEVATEEEVAALEAAKKSQEGALAARQAEDAKKINKCVRCGVPTDSQEHPNHCSKCWNVDPAKPVQQDLEQDIKEALKRGVRPLELE